MKTATVLSFLLLVTGALAADRVPKEMKPKLVREGRVLLEDGFSTPELDKKWIVPAGEGAGTVMIKEGTAVMESGTGRQGAIWQKLEAGVTDATAQVLMKPYATPWMGLRFLSDNTPGQRLWKIAVVIYDSGWVRAVIPDGDKLKVLKSVKTKLTKSDWWRVAVESRGDRYLVRVNGDDVIDIKSPETEGPKLGVMLNLYGGKGAVDEVKVTAAK